MQNRYTPLYWFVYLHRNAFTHEPFYVGIGYAPDRPFCTTDRPQKWHDIVNENGYTIELVSWKLNELEAISLEADIIAKFGLLYSGGILTNQTTGNVHQIERLKTELQLGIEYLNSPYCKVGKKVELLKLESSLNKLIVTN